MRAVADLRLGAAALDRHADPACRRLAARLHRILDGENPMSALGLKVAHHGSLIAAERDLRRNLELCRWREMQFGGLPERKAAREMAARWRAYPFGRAQVDRDLEHMPDDYRGRHAEHLFVLGKLGASSLSAEGIRKIFQRLSGDNSSIFCPQGPCNSSDHDEPEDRHGIAACRCQGDIHRADRDGS